MVKGLVWESGSIIWGDGKTRWYDSRVTVVIQRSRQYAFFDCPIPITVLFSWSYGVLFVPSRVNPVF